MKILIYHNHNYPSIDGVFTSILDLYFYLIKNINVKLIIRCEDPISSVRTLRKLSNIPSIFKHLSQNTEPEADIIICSMKLLKDIYLENKINLHSNKLIILDSLDNFLIKHQFCPDYNRIASKFNRIYLLNPANSFLTLDDKVQQFEWYHKFSEERINNIRHIEGDIFYYSRRNRPHGKLTQGKYAENIGKMIFEHIYFGSKVFYSSDSMYLKDGLYYYLKLFGIDGTKTQSLKITKSQIKDIMFFKNNDKILDLLQ